MNRKQLALSLAVSLTLVAVDRQVAHAQLPLVGSRSAGRAVQNYLYSRPTVSPYLNLTSRSSSSGLPNYFTMVRPQLEQREQNMAQQRQTAQMQAQINQVQTQVRESQQSAASMMITGRVGWSARGYPRFGTYMSYYPGFHRIPR